MRGIFGFSRESNRSIKSILSILSTFLLSLAMAATTRAGSHSGQSAAFRVDTRAATSVKVAGVSSRWCDGAYGGGAGIAIDLHRELCDTAFFKKEVGMASTTVKRHGS